MNKLILATALGASTLLLAACGDADSEADTAAVDAAATETAAADANIGWPTGTRIVEEDGTTYRVNADGTRVEIANGEWRIVTEGDTRYRVSSSGVRYEIDEEGEDLDGAPDGGPGDVDVDVGTNASGNLDVDVSTDGSDATPEDGDN